MHCVATDAIAATCTEAASTGVARQRHSTIACGTGAAVSGAPRWACPSPEPLPYGPDGPIKAIVSVPIGTATPTGDLVVREETQMAAHRDIHLAKEVDHLIAGNPNSPAMSCTRSLLKQSS